MVFSRFWTEDDSAEDHWKLDLRVRNHSDAPIFDVYLNDLSADTQSPLYAAGRNAFDDQSASLMPGESASMSRSELPQDKFGSYHVTFVDSHRVEWIVNISSGELGKLKYKMIPIIDRFGRKSHKRRILVR